MNDARHYTEITWTHDGHTSRDRVINSWDGTRIMGDMVETLLPKVGFNQINGVDGVKFYTDEDNPPYATSVYVYGGQPGDEAELTMCGCFVRSSYYCYLSIRGYAINSQDQLVNYGSIIASPVDNYAHAWKIFKDDHGTITYDIKGKENASTDPGTSGLYVNWYWDNDAQYYPNDTLSFGNNDVTQDFIRYIESDFPIFEDIATLEQYVRTGDPTLALNYNDKWQLDSTDYYFIYNLQSTGKLFNGKLTEVSGATREWHSLKFAANKEPVLYFDNAFGIVLKAPAVVCSKAVQGPGYVIDNIPEEGWTEGVLEYSGPFYGTLEARIECTGSLPDNGTYSYGFECNTNIHYFMDEAAADYALETGDFSGAANYYTLQDGNTHLPIVTGDDDASTTFASGPALSPFVTSYICSKNDVLNVANAFYTNDTTILDNIKAGLSLMGSEPFQALCGLSWYPFDINKIATAQAQSWVYFGSYKYEPGSLSIDKIISLKSPGYLDAGSIYIESLFGSYRDLAPYTTLQIYLPFHGWEQIDIAKYYKKTLSIRYYVDIYTNTYACALVASGGGKSYIGDIFSGNIGISLPITGSNMSEYGNSMLRAVLGTGAGIAGGAMAGLTVGNLPGAILGAGVGAAASLAGGMFEMSQKGAPKDHLMTKGAYSGGSSAYMPTNVIIRYDIHNLIVPSNLSALYGKPSSASGPVSAFSGFLQADTMKLNTSGMLANEIAAIERMLKEGIFV